MYMYYLLGWKGYIVKNPQKLPVRVFFHLYQLCTQNYFCQHVSELLKCIKHLSCLFQRQNNTRDSLISMDGEIFLLPQYDNDSKRKFISDDHTYILALDGDTDFHPKAVILLVDRSASDASVYCVMTEDWDWIILQYKSSESYTLVLLVSNWNVYLQAENVWECRCSMW